MFGHLHKSEWSKIGNTGSLDYFAQILCMNFVFDFCASNPGLLTTAGWPIFRNGKKLTYMAPKLGHFCSKSKFMHKMFSKCMLEHAYQISGS